MKKWPPNFSPSNDGNQLTIFPRQSHPCPPSNTLYTVGLKLADPVIGSAWQASYPAWVALYSSIFRLEPVRENQLQQRWPSRLCI